MKPLNVLIDRNLEEHALTAETVVQPRTVKWGPHAVTSNILGYRGKVLPTDDWLLRQLRALPTVARLAHDGVLVFCTTVEIGFERFNTSAGFQGCVGDLFRDIKYKHIPAAIERSYFSQSFDTGKYASGAAQADWYREFLLEVDENQLLEALKDYTDLPNFDRQNIANLGRFKGICKYLDTDDHRRDAFHLWTAEVNELDYFLTDDQRFINKMTLSTPLDLPTPPVGPASLLEKLGIRELDPLPLSDQRFRYLIEPDS